MDQPAAHTPLEMQSDFPRNPDNGRLNTVDVATEQKEMNEGEVIIRCESFRCETSAWLAKRLEEFTILTCVIFLSQDA